jgi:hypothetical protein
MEYTSQAEISAPYDPSMHLFWRLPNGIGPVTRASVVFELTQPPAVEQLYFWALQASFVEADGTELGAAHTGLQWNPRHPDGRAVNWGGYPSAHSNWKRNIGGSVNQLPGFDDDQNTRHYDWQPHRPYRLAIDAVPGEPFTAGARKGRRKIGRLGRTPLDTFTGTAWRATVTDLTTGSVQVLRDLYGGGSELRGLCVWTEWFCDCDDPTVAVTWTEFRFRTADGVEHEPTGVSVNHPSDGNCTNTSHRIITQTPELVIEQRMNTEREILHGTVIPIRLPPSSADAVSL